MDLRDRIIQLLPRNQKLFHFFRRYIDYYNGDNNSDMYTNGELNFLKQKLVHCNVVFDIGANIGQWTKLALTINKNLNIHCFEPSKFTFEKLINNKFPSNVICNNFGLSSIKAEKTLYIFEKGSGMNSVYQRQGLEIRLRKKNKKENIQVDTLENYCINKGINQIDFMKLDVEGHELEVLKGGESLFKNQCVNVIQFEYGGCDIDARVFLKDFFNFFSGMNYNFFKIYPNRIEFVKRYNQQLDNFQYQNWLIFKKS